MPAAQLEEAAGDAVNPLQGLVTVGLTSTGQLLIKLETPRLTALAGPPAAARPLLDAMAVELATAASSGFAQILLVGFGPELDQLELVQRVDQLEDALPGLERQAREAAELVDKLDCGSVRGGRIAGDHQAAGDVTGRVELARPVGLTDARAVDEAVPDPGVVLGEGDPGLGAGVVEQAQQPPVGHLRRHREVGPARAGVAPSGKRLPGRTRTWPGAAAVTTRPAGRGPGRGRRGRRPRRPAVRG